MSVGHNGRCFEDRLVRRRCITLHGSSGSGAAAAIVGEEEVTIGEVVAI